MTAPHTLHLPLSTASQGKHTRLLGFCIAVWTLAWACAGPFLHPVETYGAELDNYVMRAEMLCQGIPSDDRFHPFLYVDVVAALHSLGLDSLAAGRLVSTASGGLLLYWSARLALSVSGPMACWWTFLILAANPLVIAMSMQAASDMTGTCLLMFAIWRTLFAGKSPGSLFFTGLAWGLTVATRFNFVIFTPLAAVFMAFDAFSLGPRARALRQIRSWAPWSAAGFFVGYLTNLVPTCLANGNLYQVDNWKNLAYKLSGWDTGHLLNPPYTSASDLLNRDWDRLLSWGACDFLHYWSMRLGDQLSGECGSLLASAATSLVVLAGALHSISQSANPALRRVAALLWMGTAFVCLTFHTDIRLMLFALPLALTCTLASLDRLPALRLLMGAPAAALLFAICLHAPSSLQRFIAGHPIEEIAAARAVARSLPVGDSLLSCLNFLVRYTDRRTVAMPMPSFQKITPAELYRTAEEHGAKHASQVFVYSCKSCGMTKEQMLDAMPRGYEVLHSNNGAIVFRMPLAKGNEWLRQVSVRRNPDRSATFRVDVAKDQELATVSLALISDDGANQLLPLVGKGTHGYEASLALAPDVKGTVRAIAHAIRPDGTILHSDAVTLQLE